MGALGLGLKKGIEQRAMPLEVGGALCLRLEAPAFAKATARQGGQRSDVRGQKTEILLWERLSAAIRMISSIYRLLLTAYFSIL